MEHVLHVGVPGHQGEVMERAADRCVVLLDIVAGHQGEAMERATDRCVAPMARVPGNRAGLSSWCRSSEAIACHDVWPLRWCHGN
eukprot:8058524-Prorocentrum_lima.AAC.1